MSNTFDDFEPEVKDAVITKVMEWAWGPVNKILDCFDLNGQGRVQFWRAFAEHLSTRADLLEPQYAFDDAMSEEAKKLGPN